jgi:hypothetical protein
MKPKNHRSIFRPRNVKIDDIRSPMVRLLQDCNNSKSGMIEVEYAQQWPTLIKAMNLGLVDDYQRITESGKAFITKQT